MPSIVISVIVFACVSGGAAFGLWLHRKLPTHHRDSESRDLVKLGMGFVATMTALLLGLLVASTKGTYDTQKAEVTDIASRIVLLDRLLANYGPESQTARQMLLKATQRMYQQFWPGEDGKPPELEPNTATGDALYDALDSLAPTTEKQRVLKGQATSMAVEISRVRWQLFEQAGGVAGGGGGSSISTPMLVVVISWLTFIFVCYGYLAPRNATVVVTLLICSLTVSSSLLLILEMDQPFSGLISIRSDSVRSAIDHMGKAAAKGPGK